MRTIPIIFLAAVFACNNSESNHSSLNDSIVANRESNAAKDEHIKTDFTKDTIIVIRFPKDSISVTVTGKINGINKPVTVSIPVTTGSQLTALLVPEDSAANIRINQFFSPDGKADGPFGRSLNKEITQHGDYKLIIGENLMQGDEWKGKFTLKVTVN